MQYVIYSVRLWTWLTHLAACMPKCLIRQIAVVTAMCVDTTGLMCWWLGLWTFGYWSGVPHEHVWTVLQDL